MSPFHRVSALIVTWNSASTIARCLDSLPPEVEVVVVDNGSSDDTVSRIRAHQRPVYLIENTVNLGFGAACNLAVRHASGAFYLLLNPDAELRPHALERMQEALVERPELGCLGPSIRDANGRLELSWGSAPTLLNEWRRRDEHHGRRPMPDLPFELTSVDWISGACMMLRAEAWEAVDGFDANYFLYFEDVDLCRRLSVLGWGVALLPSAEVTHLRGASASQASARVEAWYREGQLRYYFTHNSWQERLMLRFYLIAKYLGSALRGNHPGRQILKLALGGPWAFR